MVAGSLVVHDASDDHTAHYDAATRTLTIRSSTGPPLFVDRRDCTAMAFLPASLPGTLLVGDDTRRLSLVHAPDPGLFDPAVLDVAPYEGHLVVSPYTPNIHFAFVSSGAVHVYELVLSGNSPRAIAIRRYRISDDVRWISFSDAKSLVCVTGRGGDLTLRWFSLDRIREIRSAQIGNVDFVDAAVSPADADRVAVLGGDGYAEVFCKRAHGERAGRTPAAVARAREVNWSRYGTAIEIVDDDDQLHRFLEATPDVWEEGNELDP
jgi:hypothetical protein